jgi:hypothetical protein
MLKKILLILLFSNLYSQFGEVDITYEYNQRLIKDNKIYILEEFNQLIKNYFEISTFSSEYNDLNIPIKVHIIYEKVHFNGENDFNKISCQLFLTNQTDQYYFSKNISFQYYNGKTIYHNPTFFDPLSSFFDYYAYLFIAGELDSYELFLGGPYYQKCLNICNIAIDSGHSSLWSVFEDDIKDMKNNEELRIARYNFYYCLDMINSSEINIDSIKSNMIIFLENIKSIYDKFGYDKSTLKFINAFHIEIADLLHLLNMENELKFLIKFDNKNKTIYESYLE